LRSFRPSTLEDDEHRVTDVRPLRRSINPLLPSNEFIPDGEPRVFGDRVYLYGSHDLAVGGICAGDYVTWSAPLADLTDWRFEGVIYAAVQDPFIARRRATGKNGIADRLFAPDVLDIGGRFYLYYGVGLSATGFGVAVADSPTGPFEYVGRVRYPDGEKPADWKDDTDGIDDGDSAFGAGHSALRSMISGLGEYPYDPAILHHDGRLFLYFGLLNCSVVELDPTDKRTVIRNPDTGDWVTPILRSSPVGVMRAWLSGRRHRTVMVNGRPSVRSTDASSCRTGRSVARASPGCTTPSPTHRPGHSGARVRSWRWAMRGRTARSERRTASGTPTAGCSGTRAPGTRSTIVRPRTGARLAAPP